MAVLLEGFWGPHCPRIHTPSKRQGDPSLEAALCRTVFLSVVSGSSPSGSPECQLNWLISELDSSSVKSLPWWLNKQKQTNRVL